MLEEPLAHLSHKEGPPDIIEMGGLLWDIQNLGCVGREINFIS